MGTDDIIGFSELNKTVSLARMVAAEFIGTLLLVLIGCGSIIFGAADIVRIALTFGLVVATVVQAIGHVSGGHVNPAVTISFFITGHISLLRALIFIIAQVLGGTAGAGILYALLPSGYKGNLGITDLGKSVTEVQGLFMELILTAFLVLVIHGVCDGNREDVKGSAPLAIGLSITACHLSAIPYTGSSLNPARSFGPALVDNFWDHHWIYWIGPLLGGVIAGLCYKFVFRAKDD